MPNKATREVREVAARLIDDPEYLSRLRQRLLDGELSPAVEMMLWHYAKGKPKDGLEVSGADSGRLTVSWLPEPPAGSSM